MDGVGLNKKGDFIVKESALTNLLIGGFFLLLFTFAVVNYLNDPYRSNDRKTDIFFKIMSLTLIPATIFIVKGLMHKTVIVINKSGIYYLGRLETNWANFIEASIKQDEITGSIQDNFVLMLQFYREGENGYFERKIPLRDTQTKSEEEIIAAIKYFDGAFKATNSKN